jgi:predicted AAA+ superfamily ATPase
MYFWRGNTGNEMDCLIDENDGIKSIEIKSSTQKTEHNHQAFSDLRRK